MVLVGDWLTRHQTESDFGQPHNLEILSLSHTEYFSLFHWLFQKKNEQLLVLFPGSELLPKCGVALSSSVFAAATAAPAFFSLYHRPLYFTFLCRKIYDGRVGRVSSDLYRSGTSQVYRRFGLGVYYRPFLYRRVRRHGSEITLTSKRLEGAGKAHYFQPPQNNPCPWLV